jgi:hypothetical protein
VNEAAEHRSRRVYVLLSEVLLMPGAGDGLGRHWRNSANRNVAVDDIGTCGTKVVSVNIMNSDAYVIGEIEVIYVNWSYAT